MKILQTSDYDKFITLNGNRKINQKKVNDLLADIENGLNLMRYCPIIVKENDDKQLVILDGQHRFTACVKIDHQINYVIAKDISLRDLARMNNRQDKWRSIDFLECYLKLDLVEYKIMQEFMAKYSLSFTCAAALLETANTANKTAMEHFRDGKLNVDKLPAAEKLMDIILDVFGRYVFFNSPKFIAAIVDIIKADLVDWEVMKQKVKSAPNAIEMATTKKEWITSLEKLYNHRNQKRAYLI